MAEDYYNGFDYYNAEPPRESATPPPEEAAAAVPADEFNEQVHDSGGKRRKAKSIIAMLALSGFAVSFMAPGVSLLPSAEDLTGESTVIESSASGSEGIGPEESAAVTGTSAPATTPTPAPTPTPVPLPTEDLKVRLDSFEMYPLDKFYLAEIKFTLATNSGIKLSSITGTIDANLFKYDGYNAKTNKVKSHTEKYHQDFSVESAKLVTGTGVSNSEMQYTAFVNVPVDTSSEDSFSVTLTVSNTLNGEMTEDKTVSLKNIRLWNDEKDTHVSSTAEVKTVRNGNTYELTVTPKAGVTVKGISLSNAEVFARKGTTYLKYSDFNNTADGNRITVSSKKKKVPSKADAYFIVLVEFEMTDSTGNTVTGKNRISSSLKD